MADTHRWAVLTYSSFDTGTGSGGGWQVKQTLGGMTAKEQEFLRARVVTNFDAATELAQFPTPEEIAAFPRRLVYLRGEGDTAAYWHSVPAGVDGTGRPGNVFSHAVLDRATSEPGDLRPIDTWRSAWLAPFGQAQVVGAELESDTVPPPGDAVTAETVLDFLLDLDVWRGGILSVLLDAVSAALGGGQPVVLVSESPDSAALWVGAISHLMSPATSRGFGFSVFERASAVEGLVSRGAALIAVPQEDAEAVAKLTGVVVINESESPSLGDLGGDPHSTAAGSVVAVTAWSVMAAVAIQDRDVASNTLEAIDAISAEFASTRLALAWPLAMAVGLSPGPLDDAKSEAARILSDSSPENLAEKPQYWATTAALTGTLFGTTTEQAWTQLHGHETHGNGSVMRDVELAVYVERVLADPAWLTRAGGVPVPAWATASPAEGEHLVPLALAAVAALDARARTEPASIELGGATLRLADFLIRIGLVSSPADPGSLAPSLELLVERTAIETLMHDDAGDLLAAIGPVSERLLSAWVRPLIAASTGFRLGVPGRRVPGPVLDWLYPAEAPVVPPPPGRLFSDLEIDRIARDCELSRPGALAHRANAVLALLERDGFTPSAANVAPLIRNDPPWSARDVVRVEREFPGTLPASLIENLLFSAPWDEDLMAVCDSLDDAILAGTVDVDLYQASLLRRASADISAGRPPRVPIPRVTAALNSVIARRPPGAPPIPGTELGSIVSVLLDALARGSAFELPVGTAEYLTASAKAVDPAQSQATFRVIADSGTLAPAEFERLATLAVRGAVQSPIPLTGFANLVLSKLAPAGHDESFVFQLTASALAAAAAPAVDDIADRIVRSAGDEVYAVYTEKRAEKLVSEFDRFSRAFWKRLRAQGPQQKPRITLGGVFGAVAPQKSEES